MAGWVLHCAIGYSKIALVDNLLCNKGKSHQIIESKGSEHRHIDVVAIHIR